MDDGVGQADIIARQMLLVFDQIRCALLIAVDGPFIIASGKACERDVHIIRRATHQTDRELRNPFEAFVPPDEVRLRSRNDMADIDRLACFRIRHEAYISLAMLQVEDLAKGMRRPAECGMAGHIAHLLAADPDLATVIQAAQELGSRPCRHGSYS
jgi:hypothetical protein